MENIQIENKMLSKLKSVVINDIYGVFEDDARQNDKTKADIQEQNMKVPHNRSKYPKELLDSRGQVSESILIRVRHLSIILDIALSNKIKKAC